MTRNILVAILLLTGIFYSAAQPLITSESVSRGEILTVILTRPEDLSEISLTLTPELKGRTLTARGFLYPVIQPPGYSILPEALISRDNTLVNPLDPRPFTLEGKELFWICLVGIPSDCTPGRYTLEIHGSGQQGQIQLIKPVYITERNFASEDIPLNRSMTELRSGEDPEKALEARHLWSLLKRVNRSSLYETGPFQIPVKEYRQSSGYGDRRTYIYSDGKTSGSLHNGMDMAAPTGTPVSAAGTGRVVLARKRIITGNTIMIEHLPGIYTLYYHMDSLNVREGQFILKGDSLGTVGSTGFVTGPHLHWELRVDGIPVDPVIYTERTLIDKERIMIMIGETIQKRG